MYIFIKHVICLCVISAYFSGCQGYTVTGGPGSNDSPNLISNAENKKQLIAINSLLVAPISVDSSVAGNVPQSLDVNSMLSKALEQEVQLKVVHAYPTNKTNKSTAQYIIDAKKMNLDGVLLTTLVNFNVREGSEVGSTMPARVDLAMQIVDAGSKQTVWQSTYHFKDEAISDNLFKIKERLQDNKPKFRSADEILDEGLRSALKDFSQKRLSGFIR